MESRTVASPALDVSLRFIAQIIVTARATVKQEPRPGRSERWHPAKLPKLAPSSSSTSPSGHSTPKWSDFRKVHALDRARDATLK
ncbi:hypothetical protein BST61_g5764 [Cercospora zeina]